MSSFFLRSYSMEHKNYIPSSRSPHHDKKQKREKSRFKEFRKSSSYIRLIKITQAEFCFSYVKNRDKHIKLFEENLKNHYEPTYAEFLVYCALKKDRAIYNVGYFSFFDLLCFKSDAISKSMKES